MQLRVVIDTVQVIRQRRRGWLLGARGFGGDQVPWLRRAHGEAGELPENPLQRPGWKPWLTTGGFGGDQVPWLRRSHGEAGQVEENPLQLPGWKPWLVPFTPVTDQLPWLRREHGQAGEIVGDASSIRWGPWLVTHTQPFNEDMPWFHRLVPGDSFPFVDPVLILKQPEIYVTHIQPLQENIPWLKRDHGDAQLDAFFGPLLSGHPPTNHFPIPPPIGRSLGRPTLLRVPDATTPAGRDRLRRFTEILSALVNSLVARGQLRQIGPEEWEIVP